MRLPAIFVAAAFVSVSGSRAHADAMAPANSPEVAFSVPAGDLFPEEAIASPVPVALPAEAAAVLLTTQTGSAVTPEPSSVVLMGSGFIGFGGLAWRRRRLSRAGDRSGG